MRAIVQRVSEASVTVAGDVVADIGRGLLVLIGVTDDDTSDESTVLAAKVADLRIFPDDAGLMNRSITEVDGACLVVPQFTLYGSVRKGRRPSFTNAARPDHAAPMVEHFSEQLESHTVSVHRGVFGAHMRVSLVNDGPVTILIEASAGRIL